MLKRKRKDTSFEDKIKQAKYERLNGTLRDILNTELKMTDSDGNEITDYEMTCRAIKTKARLAIDFTRDLDKDE